MEDGQEKRDERRERKETGTDKEQDTIRIPRAMVSINWTGKEEGYTQNKSTRSVQSRPPFRTSGSHVARFSFILFVFTRRDAIAFPPHAMGLYIYDVYQMVYS